MTNESENINPNQLTATFPSIGHNSATAYTGEHLDRANYHHRRSRHNALEVAGDWVASGKELIAEQRSRRAAGLRDWQNHLQDNFEGGYTTACNYMRLAKAVETGRLNLQYIAGIGLAAALTAIRNTKRVDPKAYKRRKIEYQLNKLKGKPQKKLERAKLVKALEDIDEDAAPEDQNTITGQFNSDTAPPTRGEMLHVWWKEADAEPTRQGVYVWLTGDFHTQPKDRRYKWLSLEYGQPWEHERCRYDVSREQGEPWETVLDRLVESVTDENNRNVQFKLSAGDTQLLEHFYGFVDVMSMRRSAQ